MSCKAHCCKFISTDKLQHLSLLCFSQNSLKVPMILLFLMFLWCIIWVIILAFGVLLLSRSAVVNKRCTGLTVIGKTCENEMFVLKNNSCIQCKRLHCSPYCVIEPLLVFAVVTWSGMNLPDFSGSCIKFLITRPKSLWPQ